MCLSLTPPSRTGWRPGGKKAEEHVTGEYLDAVLAEFSGYIAADELYDGPFCVLSIVDNRKRSSTRFITPLSMGAPSAVPRMSAQGGAKRPDNGGPPALRGDLECPTG